MERVSLDDLASAVGGTLSCLDGRRCTIDGVCIDSREARRGDVFWAISGPRFDGHDFVNEAFRRGAVAAVINRTVPHADGPTVTVNDTVEALGSFSRWYRSLLDAFIIGITGSVGKTTTRELVFAALGGSTNGTRSKKNYNNRLGVPLTLLDIRRTDRYGVVEMGADRLGDIANLARIACPEIGVITWLGVAHLETFGNENAIVRAKGELVESLPIGGLAVLPGDQPAAHPIRMRTRSDVAFVGRHASNNCVVAVRNAAPGELDFTVNGVPFRVPANGRHFAVPAGMAVTVARRLGRTDAQIAEGLRSFEHVAGRCRVAINSPWTIIDDAYNANPDSMLAALDALAEWTTKGRRVFVCGDMYGLGDATAEAHVKLGQRMAARDIDFVVAIGQQARFVTEGAIRAGMEARRLAVFADRRAAAMSLATILREGDTVWVKASRPLELELLVEELIAIAEARDLRRRPAA